MINKVSKKVSKLVYTYGIYLPTFFYSWIIPTFTNFYQLPTLVYRDIKNALVLPFARLYPFKTGQTSYLYTFRGNLGHGKGLKMDKISVFWCSMVSVIFYYRNHEIKNVVYNRFRAIEGGFNYLLNCGDIGQSISKHNTNNTFNMYSACQNFYKLRSGLI